MAKRLQAKLFTGWRSVDGPRQEYPFRFVRDISDNCGVLDVAFAEYQGGEPPNPSCEDLVKLATNAGPAKELVDTEYGHCSLGKYGTAVFCSNDFQYIKRWFLSNGYDFIIAEYHNYVTPENLELEELEQIVKSLDLTEEQK